MTNTKHTPGPWYLTEPIGGEDISIFARTKSGCPLYICRVYGGGFLSKDTAERNGNARLIAAAPKMREALAVIIPHLDKLDNALDGIPADIQEAAEIGLAAIAEAEGE